jgi:hypothetical protein
MKLEVLDPKIEYTIHSPYDLITHDSTFVTPGPTEDILNTFTVQETMLVSVNCYFNMNSINLLIGISCI